jgi:Cu/Ag efflux protein CusF
MVRLPKWLTGLLALGLLVSLAAPTRAEEYSKGTIKTVDVGRSEVVLKGVLSDSVFHLDKGAWVVIDGRKSKLGDLKEGDKVTVEYNKKGNDMAATAVRCLRNASETNGAIRFVIANKNQIVLRGTVKDTAYTLDKNAKIYVNRDERNLSDLREGDQVYLTYVQRGDDLMVSEVRCARK